MTQEGQVTSCVTQCWDIKMIPASTFYICARKLSSFLSLSAVTNAGTDVMLLDNFSTDACGHPQLSGNPSVKRRSSVTFEDQVEQSKGICCPRLQERLKGRAFTFFSWRVWKCQKAKYPNTKFVYCKLCPAGFQTICFLFSSAENTSSVEVQAEVHKSLDTFASCLAKAIESDAKLTMFGEGLALTGGLFTTRSAPRPRYLDGQRLRLESIDEGIVKDDRDEDEEEEEKPAWSGLKWYSVTTQRAARPFSRHTWSYSET